MNSDALEVAPTLRGEASATGRFNSRGSEKAELNAAPWLQPLLWYVQQLPIEADDVLGYVQAFGGHIANTQVSNAAGLLGEGLAYGDGEIQLDPVIAWLGERARYLVTETLEATNDDAVNMREALRRMRAVLV